MRKGFTLIQKNALLLFAHNRSGGNGRVVSSCRLACLSTEKDKLSTGENVSPARRLLLLYSSFDPKPPGLFVMEKNQGACFNSDITLTRSKMDLWFENSTAVGHAYKILSSKIFRAKSRRGHKIHEMLAHEDRLHVSSFPNDK